MRAPSIAGIVAAGALLATALFFGDGTSGGRLFWISSLSVIAAVVLLWTAPVPVPRRWGAIALALLAALTLWVGLTMWWSVAPDRSWAAFDRLLAYCAFALLGLLACRVERPARTVAAGLAVLLGLVLAWALLGKVIPSLFPDGERVARLRNPVGYWNSLALVAATAMPLGLWVASRRHSREARAAGAVLVYFAELVVVLTYSRAGVAVAVVAALAWIAIERDRLEAYVALFGASLAAGLVLLWTFSRPALTDDLQPYSDRVNDGAWFGIVVLIGLALAASGEWVLKQGMPADSRERATRIFGWLLAAIVALGVVGVLVFKGGAIADEFRGSKAEVTQSPNRLADLSSSNRWTWWKEAWQLWEDAPAGGNGAGTFKIARREIRVGSIVTTEPHNLPLQFLAETGIVGFLLLLGLIGAGATAAVCAVRKADVLERGAAGALAIGLGAFWLHSLVEIHWEFVAVAAPAFFVLGVLVGLGARRSARPPRAVPVAATVVAAGALYSMTAPYASTRLVDSAYEAIDRGDAAAAVADAHSARWLNPLSTDPLLALGDAESTRADEAAALAWYREAVRLQPENSSTWYALGSFEFFTGRYRDALHDLDRAYGLDPYGPAGRPDGLLDQARAKVEGR